MDKMKEYIKFMTLIAIKYNVEMMNLRIGWIKRDMEREEGFISIDENLKDLKEKSEKLRLTKDNALSLFETHDIDKINDIINDMWEKNIFKLLINKDIDYETTIRSLKIDNISDDEYIKYYKVLFDERKNREELLRYFDTPIYIDIMRIISMGNLDLLEIYSKLIKNHLFNPNMNKSGTSDEFFWTRLPDADRLNLDELFELNKIVMCDPRTDYHLLGNGTDKLIYFLGSARVDSCWTLSEREIKNNIDIVDYAVRFNKCSILDTYRTNGNWNNYYSRPLIYDLFDHDYSKCVSSKICSLREYLLSEEGIENQINSSKYYATARNNAIEYYIKMIKNNNLEDNNLILKLENLKYCK